MLTKKDYCNHDTCVTLKELGYNSGAYAYYFPNHKEDLIFKTHLEGIKEGIMLLKEEK